MPDQEKEGEKVLTDSTNPRWKKEPFIESVTGPPIRINNLMDKIWWNYIVAALDIPATWFREKIVLPNNKKVVYYHQKFHRVPTIDECYDDDIVCQAEAHEQYKRDRRVDSIIINLLRMRYIDCLKYHGRDEAEKCDPLRIEFEDNEVNWFLKYAEMSFFKDSKQAYYKQLHRMIWERRQEERRKAGLPVVTPGPDTTMW